MRTFIFLYISLFYLTGNVLKAQNPAPDCSGCTDYIRFMDNGKKFLKGQVFDKALNEFQAAQIAARICNCNSADPSDAIQQVFNGIQRQKDMALADQKRAIKAEKNAKRALEETEKAKTEAQTALKKADKLINAFYFYADRFALAYGNKDGRTVFYFIDKNGDEVSKLGRWEKAEQFDWRGFAKVIKENTEGDYLLDTLGNSYLAAFDVKDLKPEIRALDLDGKGLRKFPEEIFLHPQLQVLLLNESRIESLPQQIGVLKNLTCLNLYANWLTSLPEQIGELKNLISLDLSQTGLTNLPLQIRELKQLTRLDLSYNDLTSLPEQIGELKNLTDLDLRDNPITLEYVEQIQQLLPKCNIGGFSDTELSKKYFDEKNYLKANLYIKKSLEKDRLNASNWFNMSFYALFTNDPQTAIHAAKKTLELSPDELSVETNLALGYLLNNQWPEAEKIYPRWKGQKFPDRDALCDELFLKDIEALEAAGITHPDFEKVKQMFKK